MAQITTITDDLTEQAWTVRLRQAGDPWGLNLNLVHDEDTDPIVEFYDARKDYGQRFASQNDGNLWGQLASSYYVSTLTEDRARLEANGLCLHMGIPSWTLRPPVMQQVFAWLDEIAANA